MDVVAAHGRFLGTQYFGALDGLRCVAILAVIWHRTGIHGESGLLSRGYLGVELFFAISGFLITTLLLRELREEGRISLRNFYVRRTLRIFPLYYTVLALYVLLVSRAEHESAAGAQFFSNLPYFLTYTYNWFHREDLFAENRIIFFFAWSLATEEQFYLFWPWAIRFARTWQLPVLVIGSLLALHYGAEWGASSGYLDTRLLWVRILLNIASPICLGCLLAFLLHRPAGFRAANFVVGRVWSAPLAAGILALALTFDATPVILIYLAMVYLVAACCVRPDHWLRIPLANPIVRYVGTISYGMYLLHMVANNAARRIAPGLDGNALAGVTVLLSIGLASISYHFYERRFLKLKERFGGHGRTAQLHPAIVRPDPVTAG